MERLICKQCGANVFEKNKGLWKCVYCGTFFTFSQENKTEAASCGYGTAEQHCNIGNGGIALNNDIAELLKKCRNEPYNARKYANLILDIDPTNAEARKYL